MAWRCGRLLLILLVSVLAAKVIPRRPIDKGRLSVLLGDDRRWGEGCDIAEVLEAGTISTADSTLEGTMAPDGMELAHKHWFKFTGNGSFVRFELRDSFPGARLSFYSGDCGSLRSISGSHDGTVRVPPGDVYFVVVDGQTEAQRGTFSILASYHEPQDTVAGRLAVPAAVVATVVAAVVAAARRGQEAEVEAAAEAEAALRAAAGEHGDRIQILEREATVLKAAREGSPDALQKLLMDEGRNVPGVVHDYADACTLLQRCKLEMERMQNQKYLGGSSSNTPPAPGSLANRAPAAGGMNALGEADDGDLIWDWTDVDTGEPVNIAKTASESGSESGFARTYREAHDQQLRLQVYLHNDKKEHDARALKASLELEMRRQEQEREDSIRHHREALEQQRRMHELGMQERRLESAAQWSWSVAQLLTLVAVTVSSVKFAVDAPNAYVSRMCRAPPLAPAGTVLFGLLPDLRAAVDVRGMACRLLEGNAFFGALAAVACVYLPGPFSLRILPLAYVSLWVWALSKDVIMQVAAFLLSACLVYGTVFFSAYLVLTSVGRSWSRVLGAATWLLSSCVASYVGGMLLPVMVPHVADALPGLVASMWPELDDPFDQQYYAETDL